MDIRYFLRIKPRIEVENGTTVMDIVAETPCISSSEVTSAKTSTNPYDIGLFMQKSPAEGTNSILGLPKKILTPTESYCFPTLGPRNLKFQRSWLHKASICVRYLDKQDGMFVIREEFLCFLPIPDFTGKIFLNFLQSPGPDCTYLFGQGYDSAKSVSGKFHGAQAVIRKEYLLALYSHCAAHSFNLAVSSACHIITIKNSLGTLQSVHSSFVYPRRHLQGAIDKDEKLKEDRVKLLRPISICNQQLCALELISTAWKDETTSSGAFQLLSAIKTLNFQISMQILSSVLQTENQDLGEAVELADAAKEEPTKRSENATASFTTIFGNCKPNQRRIRHSIAKTKDRFKTNATCKLIQLKIFFEL